MRLLSTWMDDYLQTAGTVSKLRLVCQSKQTLVIFNIKSGYIKQNDKSCGSKFHKTFS